MGNANSTAEAEAALNEADASAQRQGTGVKLFRYLPTGAAGQWVKVTDSADLDFYDANEDNEEKEAFWQLSMNNGDIDVPVDDQLDYSSNAKELRFTFTTETEALALKFPSKAAYDLFCKSFNDKLFFNKYKAENDSASRAKVLGADFAGMLYADNNDAQPMDEDDDEVAEGELLTPAREKKTRKEGTPISGIVMGALDNSFLMRGGQMEVMRNVEGGLEDRNVLFTTPIKGSSMTPSKVILASSETAMNVLNPDTPNSVLRLDLERNTVVNTWKFEKDGVEVPIRDISTNSKAAQLESHNTFLGLDNNRLCRWDMRDPSRTPVQASPVVSWTGGKDFARGTNFKCMATSGDGYVVVGSQDGKIRLYNEKTLTQAKTSFPGLGAPVTAVDVTYDGKWVVATSDKHLMLLQTIFVDKTGKQTNGFKSRMGSAAPTPKLLRLRPEDQIRTQRKPLQKAKFTWVTEQGHQERRIVASCGNYTVVWDFKKVKAATAELGLGNLPTVMDYQLLSKDDQLVDSAFMHENFRAQDRDALLAITQHDIYTIN